MMNISNSLQNIIKSINDYTETIFSPIDGLIENLTIADWLKDALIDSFHLLPLLFIVFLVIEILEFFFADKINNSIKKLQHCAIPIGSLAAIIPQCGFSVIASTLYIKKYITKGTLIGIYLATSDEAIPILIADYNSVVYVLPIIGIKVLVAIVGGYSIDLILQDKKYIFKEIHCDHESCNEETGCCSHSVSKRRKREIIFHPIKHTLSVSLFILMVTVILNFLFDKFDLRLLSGKMGMFETVITAIIGLIPNCAVSAAIALMLMKGSISFGAAMAGLLSNGGLGILILLRHKENIKDTCLIIFIMLLISISSGIIINQLHLFS